MYLRASASNPYAPNLAINKSWFNVSKAFERSMKIAQIYPPYLKLSSIFLVYNSSSAVCYDFFKILLIVLIICLSCSHLLNGT